MAEILVGKWKPEHSSFSGAEEFFSAVGQSDLLKDFEGIREIEITLDGNTITSVTHFENKESRTDVARIGETDEVTLPNGVKLLAKNRLEGDRFISDLYLGDNLALTLTRHVEGNELFSDITINGKTLTFKAERV